MKLIVIPKKKRSLRAIDQSTRYDITGKMRKLQREIERGEHGEVRNMVVAFSTKNDNNASASVKMFHWGKGDEKDVHWILSTVKNRIEPA